MSRAPEITAQKFFQAAEEHSIVKADLVSEYIVGWAKIIIRYKINVKQDPTVYVIDLFSGAGRYDDGTPSTPIKVMDRVLEADYLRDNIRFWFNDESVDMITRLQTNIKALPGSENLRHEVHYTSQDADSPEIANWFRQNAISWRFPMLVFIDPFGYKEINQELIRSIIQVPQSDIILFFNYKRINAALNNQLFESNMNRLFGEAQVKTVKEELETAKPAQRSEIIVRHLEESFEALGSKFVTAFKIVQNDQDQISHYIVGLTKHEKGFELFKKIMKKHTKDAERAQSRFGLDLFSQQRSQQQDLFATPIDAVNELSNMLKRKFAGQTITFAEIYRIHHPTAEFTETEYKEAVRRLLTRRDAFIAENSQLPQRAIMNGKQTIPDYLLIKFV
ncbi:three-Cys-motif partner protein TcmP [Spirosoma sp. KUDC1026]|uniref:three-Cys-motif partner protein TcmP n=1 Tax=Spirosoma sp. KUDC1026 TaxID=2745947 RepID=UPI00159B8B84|nr:three-Cys-motif partner protein TcmP [Spirosoma sp. KUDC1026]QKZ14332.1 three-Cys-motif partner protein TcmP [Spirosoma sp. KUDC1026]